MVLLIAVGREKWNKGLGLGNFMGLWVHHAWNWFWDSIKAFILLVNLDCFL